MELDSANPSDLMLRMFALERETSLFFLAILRSFSVASPVATDCFNKRILS